MSISSAKVWRAMVPRAWAMPAGGGSPRSSAGRAESVFHFDVQGSVAKSTHSGIPWLRFIRQRLPAVHFWPFDGWEIPHRRSAIAEVYPARWSRGFAKDGRTQDQHGAFSIAAWLSHADRDGRLAAFLQPDLSPAERTVAQVEGWILGVPGPVANRKSGERATRSKPGTQGKTRAEPDRQMFPDFVRALAFASRKHSRQRRKDAGALPYINHPIALVSILAVEAGIADRDTLCAALLHDTIEDTDTSVEELVEAFGHPVAALVQEVTDDKQLPKEEHKAHQVEHAAHLSPKARLVKLADKIANLRDVADSPPIGWSLERRQEYFDWAKQVVDRILVRLPIYCPCLWRSMIGGREWPREYGNIQ
jgi:guanosine-3',5'-bis(diphosphate) 3'-pyrophosphohydrolase